MNFDNHIKHITFPRKIVIGPGCINNIGDICKELFPARNALIITGSGSTYYYGEKVAQILESAGYNVNLVVSPKAEMSEVERIKRIISEIGGGVFLLGVGGGKAIDIAKLASDIVNSSFISVPTAGSHDGIVSSRASIFHNNRGAVSMAANPPVAVVADTTIISAAPHKLLVSGCGDIISKFTAVLDWKLAHKKTQEEYSGYASQLSEMAANNILVSAEFIKRGDEKAAEIVINALVASGIAMNIAGSSCPASGSEHKFSHALDIIAPKPALHGQQCGVGSIIMMYLHNGDWKKIKEFLQEIGAPTTAKELGIDPRYIIEALLKAHLIKKERYTILGTGLARENAKKAAEITGVI